MMRRPDHGFPGVLSVSIQNEKSYARRGAGEGSKYLPNWSSTELEDTKA